MDAESTDEPRMVKEEFLRRLKSNRSRIAFPLCIKITSIQIQLPRLDHVNTFIVHVLAKLFPSLNNRNFLE